jgi:hypothetical protein
MRNWGRHDQAGSTHGNRLDRDAPLPGVIDTIGFGFAALMLRPLVILPVVLLELYLLFGPQVLLAPVTTSLSERLERRGEHWNDIAAEIGRLEGVNVFEAGSLELPLLRTPGVVPAIDGEQLAELRIAESWSSLPGGVVVLMLLLSIAAGLLLASTFRSLLAGAALSSRAESVSLQPRLIVRRAGRTFGWMLTLAGLAILISMPVLVATIFGAVLGFGDIALLWLLLLFPATWAWVHFFFSVHAIFVDDAGPLNALRSSYQVVQTHFWQSVRFMAVSVLITTGFSYALRELATNLPGALLAILLNAVIASGMIVAAMLFYRDRATRLGLNAQLPGR